jgi:hypothetical protein
MFAVIKADTEERVSEHPNGAEAGAKANELNSAARNAGRSDRFRVVRVDDATAPVVDWRQREQDRFLDGTYTGLPWMYTAWANKEAPLYSFSDKLDHFAHVSADDPAKLAYTPDEAHGVADRQIRMRPGRYLERFYGDVLTPDEIRHWASRYAADNEAQELRFANTPSDIEDVYTRGPTSCMSHPAREYASSVHPVRVYGAGDLAVAYIERDDEVTARALCWPAKQRYGRVYGDAGRLAPLLEAAGYEQRGDFTGAKLLRIEDGDGQFVCPYLDSPNCAVDDDGDCLRIGGDINAQMTEGLTEREGYTCDHCRERCDEDDTYGVDDETWCRSCYENDAFNCQDCGETYSGEAYLTTHRGHDICESCADDYTCCNGCSENYPHRDVTRALDDEYYCDDCAAGMATTHCGELADGEDDCDCGTCEDHRASLLPENFELTGDGEPAEAPAVTKPKKHREPSPTVFDPQQLELLLGEAPVVLNNAWQARPGHRYDDHFYNVYRAAYDAYYHALAA